MKTTPRWVYGLHELNLVKKSVPKWDDVKGLLGGKGANLAGMTRLGFPVPPGFVVTTEACRAYLKKDTLPKKFWAEVQTHQRALELKTGKRFGDAAAPLLVSCRSGAKFSMPGMMDTVLNLGLTPEVTRSLATLTGDARFAWDSARRLVQMYGCVVMGVPDAPFEAVLAEARTRYGVDNDAALSAEVLETITAQFKAIVEQHAGRPFPESPEEQLKLAIEAVFRSWKGKRAFDYRKAASIPDDLGTAVNIVTMVFGNLGENSGTGVATTRNVSTGEKHKRFKARNRGGRPEASGAEVVLEGVGVRDGMGPASVERRERADGRTARDGRRRERVSISRPAGGRAGRWRAGGRDEG